MKDDDPLNPNRLPNDAPFLSVRDVAVLFRMTPAALRKALESKEDKLGAELRQHLVSITTHRRLFKRRALMTWIEGNLS